MKFYFGNKIGGGVKFYFVKIFKYKILTLFELISGIKKNLFFRLKELNSDMLNF